MKYENTKKKQSADGVLNHKFVFEAVDSAFDSASVQTVDPKLDVCIFSA